MPRANPTIGGKTCWKTKTKDCESFKEGQILVVPFHVSNMDRNLTWRNCKLTMTNAGPVYSKCRRVVVFRKFQAELECLPLYTNGGKGIEHKSDKEKEEWVSVVDGPETDSPCEDAGRRPLAVLLKDAEKVKANSYIHITHSVMVNCAEKIDRKGMMERASFERLHQLRAELNRTARKEGQESFEEECRRRGR